MKSAQELKDKLAEAKSLVEIGSTYTHYKKSDKYYTIADLVIIEALEEVGVVYQAEYDDLKGVRFLRPISNFLGKVDLEGNTVDRFARIKL